MNLDNLDFGSGEGEADTDLVGEFMSEAPGDGYMDLNSSSWPWIKERNGRLPAV